MKIIIFAAIVILSNCEVLEPIWTDKNQKKREQRFGYLIMWSSIKGSPTRTITEKAKITDNKNGSLNYLYTINSYDLFGQPTQEQKTILVQRCLIGQVYRTAENDCRGNGTKDTPWGALDFQWCTANDRSCEKDGVADPALSPAAKVCSDSNFLGKKWRLGSKIDKLYLYLWNAPLEAIQDLYVSDPTKGVIPISWLNESLSIAQASYAGVGIDYSYANKITNMHIMCVGEDK